MSSVFLLISFLVYWQLVPNIHQAALSLGNMDLIFIHNKILDVLTMRD